MLRLRSRRWLLFLCLSLAALSSARPRADDLAINVSNADAYVTHAASSQTWSIGSGGLSLVLGFDASKNLVVQSLSNPSTGDALDVEHAPDTDVTIDGDRLVLNQSNDKMTFVSATGEVTASGVRLVFTFTHRTLHTVIHRTYASYPGSPTIETWTRLEAAASAPSVQINNLTGWQLTMPDAPVRWVNGLRGDSASQPIPDGDSFAIDGGQLDEGETDIGSTRRSSEVFVPIVFVDGGADDFYGGLIWSGSWRLAMVKTGGRLTVTASLPGVSTALTPDHPVEFPHTFFGYAPHDADAAALRQFVMQGLRGGRPVFPRVTYNTWFPYGTSITEDDVDNEMYRAASIGVERFVLDAGWWAGASTGDDPHDFSTNLGSFTPDPDRFPAQLIGLSDEAHFLGMQFGLWVEPERLALSSLGDAGSANEQWLATNGGSYDSDGRTAQLCLASAAARKWLFSRLVNLIDTVHPDYIKWDNNLWVNCDRPGHGHGASDGNFLHVLGLYSVLDALRQRYPDLEIENVSGGGNRLDFGMAAYTEAAWMDDLSAPSSHVRHNLEGLSSVFPPAYLLSFVIDGNGESLFDDDLAQIVRSRMPGMLGFTYRSDALTDDIRARFATEIARYKAIRDTIASAGASLLTAAAPAEDSNGWDVIEDAAVDGSSAVVFAFNTGALDGTYTVHPTRLSPSTTYVWQSVDDGASGAAPGADLLSGGITISQAPDQSRAHIIVLRAQ